MPWNIIDKLEQMLISFNKKGIEKINYNELEKNIIQFTGSIHEKTITRYIDTMIKLNWLKYNKNGEFEIIYIKDEEIF
jgi:hypothetical protein